MSQTSTIGFCFRFYFQVRKNIIAEEVELQVSVCGISIAIFSLNTGLGRKFLLDKSVGNVILLVSVFAKPICRKMESTKAEGSIVVNASDDAFSRIRLTFTEKAVCLQSDGWVYGHGTFCWVACKTRLLGAFKWRRNSSNEAKRMWVETGKLKGLARTVLMDSKADEQALFREFQRQRGIRLLTTARKGAAKSPGRQRMVKILNQRKNKQIDNQRRSTVEPRQGLLKEIFELERCWMRGNRNNRWVFAAMGVAVRLHQYRAWQARRSPWAIKQEVLGR